MTHEYKTDSILDEANALEQQLHDAPVDAATYLHEATATMKELATVVDRTKLTHSADLLTRNLVNACNNDELSALGGMTDVYKEVLYYGQQMTGVDFSKLEGGESDAQQLQDLQIALNGDLELPVELDPQVLTGMIEALMLANSALLTQPEPRRNNIMRHTSLRYYVDNVVAAKRGMEVIG
jgi:hypothetical protein